MNLHIADTDIFTLYTRDHMVIRERVHRMAENEIVLSIITVDEVWTGWKAYINKAKNDEQIIHGYLRLTKAQEQLSAWPIVTLTLPALQLADTLRKQKLNIGANDLKIAAIALTLNATVVTRNVRDFQRVPNLKIEDWTKQQP